MILGILISLLRPSSPPSTRPRVGPLSAARSVPLLAAELTLLSPLCARMLTPLLEDILRGPSAAAAAAALPCTCVETSKSCAIDRPARSRGPMCVRVRSLHLHVGWMLAKPAHLMWPPGSVATSY
jgi:hypothetical protein